MHCARLPRWLNLPARAGPDFAGMSELQGQITHYLVCGGIVTVR